MSTPTKELTKSYKISKDSIAKIRSFLEIILKEIWLIKRQEPKLAEYTEENLRMVAVNVGRIAGLLPGGKND